jgi:predicted  nucleic acid-binding Zn-ribbon protein
VACETVWSGPEPETLVACPKCGADTGERCRDETSSFSAAIPPHPERRKRTYDAVEDLEPCPAGVGEPATDGSRDIDTDGWYVVDEGRRRVLAGPLDHEGIATAEARQRGTATAVLSGSRLRELDADPQTEVVWALNDDDVEVVTDGGLPKGAIDNEFDDAERSPGETLLDALADIDARTHGALTGGDVAIDLVTRQPLLVRQRVADNLAEYYEEEGFDLLTYKQHAFLPVHIDDAVFECVFVGSIDDLHSEGKTYDYPAGRLARVPAELAGGDE